MQRKTPDIQTDDFLTSAEPLATQEGNFPVGASTTGVNTSAFCLFSLPRDVLYFKILTTPQDVLTVACLSKLHATVFEDAQLWWWYCQQLLPPLASQEAKRLFANSQSLWKTFYYHLFRALCLHVYGELPPRHRALLWLIRNNDLIGLERLAERWRTSVEGPLALKHLGQLMHAPLMHLPGQIPGEIDLGIEEDRRQMAPRELLVDALHRYGTPDTFNCLHALVNSSIPSTSYNERLYTALLCKQSPDEIKSIINVGVEDKTVVPQAVQSWTRIERERNHGVFFDDFSLQGVIFHYGFCEQTHPLLKKKYHDALKSLSNVVDIMCEAVIFNRPDRINEALDHWDRLGQKKPEISAKLSWRAPLRLACRLNHVALVKTLVERNAKKCHIVLQEDYEAANTKWQEIANLSPKNPKQIYAEFIQDAGALYRAAQNANQALIDNLLSGISEKDCCKLLFSSEVILPDPGSRLIFTPLVIAIYEGREYFAQYLVEKYYKGDLISSGDFSYLIREAAEHRQQELLYHLLVKSSAAGLETQATMFAYAYEYNFPRVVQAILASQRHLQKSQQMCDMQTVNHTMEFLRQHPGSQELIQDLVNYLVGECDFSAAQACAEQATVNSRYDVLDALFRARVKLLEGPVPLLKPQLASQEAPTLLDSAIYGGANTLMIVYLLAQGIRPSTETKRYIAERIKREYTSRCHQLLERSIYARSIEYGLRDSDGGWLVHLLPLALELFTMPLLLGETSLLLQVIYTYGDFDIADAIADRLGGFGNEKIPLGGEFSIVNRCVEIASRCNRRDWLEWLIQKNSALLESTSEGHTLLMLSALLLPPEATQSLSNSEVSAYLLDIGVGILPKEETLGIAQRCAANLISAGHCDILSKLLEVRPDVLDTEVGPVFEVLHHRAYCPRDPVVSSAIPVSLSTPTWNRMAVNAQQITPERFQPLPPLVWAILYTKLEHKERVVQYLLDQKITIDRTYQDQRDGEKRNACGLLLELMWNILVERGPPFNDRDTESKSEIEFSIYIKLLRLFIAQGAVPVSAFSISIPGCEHYHTLRVAASLGDFGLVKQLLKRYPNLRNMVLASGPEYFPSPIVTAELFCSPNQKRIIKYLSDQGQIAYIQHSCSKISVSGTTPSFFAPAPAKPRGFELAKCYLYTFLFPKSSCWHKDAKTRKKQFFARTKSLPQELVHIMDRNLWQSGIKKQAYKETYARFWRMGRVLLERINDNDTATDLNYEVELQQAILKFPPLSYIFEEHTKQNFHAWHFKETAVPTATPEHFLQPNPRPKQ